MCTGTTPSIRYSLTQPLQLEKWELKRVYMYPNVNFMYVYVAMGTIPSMLRLSLTIGTLGRTATLKQRLVM